jgi:L-alanine-DL-glutamate epimerase-like enolase superfamily enzyme
MTTIAPRRAASVTTEAARKLVEHFDWLEPLFNERLELRDGRMLIPPRPGLGLTVSEQAASWRVAEAEATA